MRLPKIREVREALTSFFTAPYTTKYPAGPAAEFPDYRGLPKFNAEFCVGCGACAQVCPTQAIEVVDDVPRKVRTLRVDYGSCIQCGQCHEKCITGKGIDNSHAYSLSVADLKAPEVFETVEKELVVCECCGEPIACKDHLLWIRERLGARAYAHPNLLLATQRLLMDAEASLPKSRPRREDQIKDACPKCRQKIVTIDEFLYPRYEKFTEEKEKMATVRNILRTKGPEVWTVSPDATVFKALKLMAEKGVGALPVSDSGGVVGIFSERDYARTVALKGKSSLDTPVSEIMSSPVYAVGLSTGADECMALMTEKHVRHLPVFDGKKLVGIISIGDVVKSLIGEQQVAIERLKNYIMGKYA
jgi:CBS domain-containing protein/formate hydrogenlyase subunit 6/NADH:ubiquinone oxidoreductase subunit I